MKHKILIAVAMVFFASCMKIKKKGDDEAPSPVSPNSRDYTEQVPQSVGLSNTVTYTYLSSLKDGLDKVQFSKPANWSSNATLKKSDKEKLTQINVTFDENGHWTDFLNTENKVTYQFFSESGELQELQVLPSLELVLKDDLNLATKFEINEKTKVIRIRYLGIEAGKHLFIEDFSGQLIIDKLETSEGTIQTFAESSRAANETNGKNGGIVDIKIAAGSGNLKIIMAGQAGGNGKPADAPDASMKGVSGTRGAHAKFEIASLAVFTGLDGGTSIDFYGCSVPPKMGGDGGPGVTGHSGNNGFMGGNSGSAIVENLSNDLSVDLQSVAGGKGLRSEGGDGGDGGDPGQGGDGGQQDLNLFIQETGARVLPLHPSGGTCPAAPSGSRGSRGYKGDPGLDGVVGRTEKSCLVKMDKSVACTNE